MRKTWDSSKHVGDRGVESSRRREVDAEGLLADDLRVLVESGRAQHLDDAEQRAGRHGEVEESLDVAADLLLGARDGVDEFAGAVFFGVGEGEVLLELLPVGALGLVRTELAHRVVGALSKLLVREGRGLTRTADDPVVLRQEPGDGEVEQTRQDLALGEVTGGAEHHEDVIRWHLGAHAGVRSSS